MRSTLLGTAAISALVVALAGALPASGNPPLVGSSQYVIRVDPRLCPSPMCGGYWVALANRSRTRCSDGARRPRCYVARAVDEDRQPLAAGLPDGALVRADIEPWTFEGFGELGALVVADVFSPAGRAPPSGRFFRLVDTGIRCVRAPCCPIRASRLNRSAQTPVSLIIDDSGVPEEVGVRIQQALATRGGVLAQGRFVRSSELCRFFLATRFFLRSEG